MAEAVPGAGVELVDVSRKLHFQRNWAVLGMVNTLGLAVYPVFTVGSEIDSMGPPVVEELGPLIRARLGQGEPLAADSEG